ncbi:MAG: AcrR family transcriptional regulator [Paracoccaceae bacterium]|jgi:AcrR family transcriptional regulator
MKTNKTQFSRGRQTEIVKVTMELAFEVGPNAVSTSLIADRLGVSQPAIYKHFKSKDAIWLLVSEQLAQTIIENVKTSRASTLPPLQNLRDLVMRHMRFIQSVPALPDIMIMRQTTGSHKVIRLRLQSEMAQLHEIVVALASRAQNQNQIRDDIAATDVATLVTGVMQGLVLRMIISRNPSQLAVDCDRLLNLQLETLAPRGLTP